MFTNWQRKYLQLEAQYKDLSGVLERSNLAYESNFANLVKVVRDFVEYAEKTGAVVEPKSQYFMALRSIAYYDRLGEESDSR